MYEDWVDETLALLEATASAPATRIATLLLQAFNDLDKANAMTQHFRVSACVKGSRTRGYWCL